jgi:hypothetical protein
VNSLPAATPAAEVATVGVAMAGVSEAPVVAIAIRRPAAP